jgi:uncharacterized membrane protein
MDTKIFLLMVCAVVFLLCLPLVLKLVPPNRFYGFRTRRTISTPDIWYRANIFSGYALMIAVAVTALIVSCVPDFSAETSAAIFVALVLAAAAASYGYAKRIT